MVTDPGRCRTLFGTVRRIDKDGFNHCTAYTSLWDTLPAILSSVVEERNLDNDYVPNVNLIHAV